MRADAGEALAQRGGPGSHRVPIGEGVPVGAVARELAELAGDVAAQALAGVGPEEVGRQLADVTLGVVDDALGGAHASTVGRATDIFARGNASRADGSDQRVEVESHGKRFARLVAAGHHTGVLVAEVTGQVAGKQ